MGGILLRGEQKARSATKVFLRSTDWCGHQRSLCSRERRGTAPLPPQEDGEVTGLRTIFFPCRLNGAAE